MNKITLSHCPIGYCFTFTYDEDRIYTMIDDSNPDESKVKCIIFKSGINWLKVQNSVIENANPYAEIYLVTKIN